MCEKQYDKFGLLHIVTGSIAILWAKVCIELHRSSFGFSDPDHTHIRLEYVFNGLESTRVCNDMDPYRTWTVTKISDQGISCVSSVLGAELMCLLGFANLLPVVFGLKPGFARLSNTLVFILRWPLITVLLVQMASGMSGAYMAGRCYLHEKQRFLMAKRIGVLSDKNRSLLCSFIPESVICKAPSSRAAMVGAHIQDVVIMFCSLQPQAALSKDFSARTFHLLHEIVCRFDDAVERFGMFKYQFVGESYIVACPRAANPFDSAP
eukprot:CAMPEP_0172211478 /NCGR_PEP_ID=MMETSP1050-20130122/36424_1 /TAXON_ID=233186 /ORGANISM="Cryptomonas curvata, Strain CCAP979/52" /LENGTH=264 /DNA_ID=CAMNT_0012891933 /DNA_START=224 /DNA_END=1015 /DNA_ORIENTATION=+